jgi:hypothetical protein
VYTATWLRRTRKAPQRRLTVARLRRVIKRDFSVQFGRALTSYGGLELLRRFFGLIGLKARIQCAFAVQRLGGDYGASHLVLLVIGLLKALV